MGQRLHDAVHETRVPQVDQSAQTWLESHGEHGHLCPELRPSHTSTTSHSLQLVKQHEKNRKVSVMDGRTLEGAEAGRSQGARPSWSTEFQEVGGEMVTPPFTGMSPLHEQQLEPLQKGRCQGAGRDHTHSPLCTPYLQQMPKSRMLNKSRKDSGRPGRSGRTSKTEEPTPRHQPMVQLEVIFRLFGLCFSSSSSRLVGSQVENFSPTPKERKNSLRGQELTLL